MPKYARPNSMASLQFSDSVFAYWSPGSRLWKKAPGAPVIYKWVPTKVLVLDWKLVIQKINKAFLLINKTLHGSSFFCVALSCCCDFILSPGCRSCCSKTNTSRGVFHPLETRALSRKCIYPFRLFFNWFLFSSHSASHRFSTSEP